MPLTEPSPGEKVAAMHSSRSEAGTDRGDIRWLVQDFIRSEYSIGRATRSAPTSVVDNAVRYRKRSDIRIYVSS